MNKSFLYLLLFSALPHGQQVSAIVPKETTHEETSTDQEDDRRRTTRKEGGDDRRRRVVANPDLSLNIKAGAENPHRIGGSGLKTRTMTVSCYGYPGDHTNVHPLGGYKWDPDRLACAIRGGKIGDSVRIRWKGHDVVALIWDHLPGSRLDSTPGLWKALGGGTYGLKKGAKVTFLGRVK